MSGPHIVYVTAGGAGMFCGSCMRDNTLAAALHCLGTSITLVPVFTPIRTDEDDVSLDRVFLGGINVYLEQRSAVFRRLPRVIRRALDSPRLLRAISRLSLQQRRSEDGRVAVSLLRGEAGHQGAEIRDLVEFVAQRLKPDLVNLTNLLIAGFVPALERRLDVPVVVTLQGDDLFLDSLETADRQAVLHEMRRLARRIDGFIVFSRFYGDLMASLLEVPIERFHVVPLGLAEPERFHDVGVRGDDPAPTVGYLARICPEKGFRVLVDAFLLLREMPGMQRARLHVAGWLGAGDRRFFDRQLRRLRDAGCGDAFEHVADVPDRAAKIRFLNRLDVFSVPTVYREPKGIYVLEALAAGVPVVQPAHGAFPELLGETGGGRLFPPGDSAALARELHALLADPDRRRALGAEGRRQVRKHHRAETMAAATLRAWNRVLMGQG